MNNLIDKFKIKSPCVQNSSQRACWTHYKHDENVIGFVDLNLFFQVTGA